MTAQLHPDGDYEVVMARGRGLPEGTYRVAIMPPRLDPPMGLAEQPPPQLKHLDIPEKYRQPSTSGLVLTVAPSDNTANFNMDSR